MRKPRRLYVTDALLHPREVHDPAAPGSRPVSAFLARGGRSHHRPRKLYASSAGGDLVSGEEGNDVVHLGAGNDVFNGGEGNDVGFLGASNDTMSGGSGNDKAYLGDGNDSFNWEAFGGNDTIEGEAGIRHARL